MGMEMLDSSILNTSLPQIAHSLNVNPIQLKAALTIYLLSLGVFIPISGWLADRIGDKQALILAIIIFTMSSIGCGLAINLPILIAFRLLQGVGGAFLLPVGRLILVRVFQDQELVIAIAKVSGAAVLGMLLGPLIGGALTTYLNWRWIFFVNVPLGIFGIYYIARHLPAFRERIKTHFDFLGFIFIGIALAALLFLFDIAIQNDISWLIKLALLITTLGCFAAYYFHARHYPNPVFDLAIFRQPFFMNAAMSSLFTRLTLSAQPFLVPLLLQAGYGYTAMQSSFFVVPLAIAVIINKPLIAPLLKRFNYKPLLLINNVVLILVFCSYSLQAIWLMPGLLIAQQFITGFSMSTQFTLMNTLTYKYLHEPYVSQGSSFYSGIVQVSGSFGIALAALTMIAVIGPSDLQRNVPLVAFKVVFLVQSLYLFFAAWMFIRIFKTSAAQ